MMTKEPWSDNPNIDQEPMFRSFDAAIAQHWTDRKRPFILSFTCFRENEKIALEAVFDWASDRKYNIEIRELSVEDCQRLKILRGPKNAVVYGATLTERL